MITCDQGLLAEVVSAVLFVEYLLGKQKLWPVKSVIGAVEGLVIFVLFYLLIGTFSKGGKK